MRVKYGWLNINKPLYMSSGKVVGMIKKIFNLKVGHAGTLDPLATGVLPIAVGEATKTISYAVDSPKSYAVTVQWGEQRSTDDAEGEVIGTSDIKPNTSDIKKALGGFIGNIQQVPPAFSAVRIGGVRAYSLARRGKAISLPSRTVCIIKIDLISVNEESNTADFLIECKRGVYIRSFARDLGIALGCLGYVSSLHRKSVGSFLEKNSITLDQLEVLANEDRLDEALLPICYAMENIPKLYVDAEVATAVRHGQSISLRRTSLNGLYATENYDMCYLSQVGGVPVAICKVVDGAARPMRVFDI
ncbi:tRNA pseudouridine(55) synthase TruB [Anaplasma capra]|uniref:tRNA pseudouridine(55) synthase TruB n=1 Tax=Anaplasma capra TaxID=1562740 RepID=UPI0021D57E40|nr:tRNA pseudouridine(55) synthase TruB [Anaplasma capra]MCU7611879.1 tRNA pseudouridine(55) synthase TruB [Anaplasma capra]MCU7612254.1 tRNA pseudouridine(55) synthase TruB [Anaplasma capra]